MQKILKLQATKTSTPSAVDSDGGSDWSWCCSCISYRCFDDSY
ncbi:MAG: hypothetical protein AAGC60_03540 [Acidobacteriota bacterium]